MTVRVKLNKKTVDYFLKGGGGVREDLDRRADRIASAAGEGMETDGAVGAKRYRASVRTANAVAMKAEAKTRALSRALDAGR